MDVLRILLQPLIASLVRGVLAGAGISVSNADVDAIVSIALSAPDEARREADITLAVARLKSGQSLGGA